LVHAHSDRTRFCMEELGNAVGGAIRYSSTPFANVRARSAAPWTPSFIGECDWLGTRRRRPANSLAVCCLPRRAMRHAGVLRKSGPPVFMPWIVSLYL
jgi:hypothetical protein